LRVTRTKTSSVLAVALVLTAVTGCASTLKLAERRCEKDGYAAPSPARDECIRRTAAAIDALSDQVEREEDVRARNQHWSPASDSDALRGKPF
jgi:hypothetical protein